MLPRTDQPAPRTTFGDRRLRAVQAFVIVSVILVVAGVALFWILGRQAPAASLPPTSGPTTPAPSVTPEVKPTLREALEPRINEYLYEDRYVLEVIVPGADPDIQAAYDPRTRRWMVTISGSPTEQPGTDGKKRYGRQEWQRAAFKRTILLPEGVSTPEVILRDGILTLSFPWAHTGLIVPRKASRP